MSDDDSDLDIPEVDFSPGVQPHRYARRETGYQVTVLLDRELWVCSSVRVALLALMMLILGHFQSGPRPARGQ